MNPAVIVIELSDDYVLSVVITMYCEWAYLGILRHIFVRTDCSLPAVDKKFKRNDPTLRVPKIT